MFGLDWEIDRHLENYKTILFEGVIFHISTAFVQTDSLANHNTGGFHLHLLVFPFVYQFPSRIEALVCSLFGND